MFFHSTSSPVAMGGFGGFSPTSKASSLAFAKCDQAEVSLLILQKKVLI